MCASPFYSHSRESPESFCRGSIIIALCDEAQKVGGNSPNPHMVSGKTVFICESVQPGDVYVDR